MKVFFSTPSGEVQFEFSQDEKIIDILQREGYSPDSVVIMKADSIIPVDSILENDSTYQLIIVASGG